MRKQPHLPDLNWNLLRSFCVIAEEGGITRAAKRLKMSQPSVSLALQKLEEQLGCQLVFRGSRHFALTLRGEKIYQECAEILHSVDRIGVLVQDSNDEEFGELRLLLISRLHSPLIDEALRLFHQRHPSITWRIEVRNSLEIVQQIARDKAGIGICLLTKPMIGLTCRPLFRERFGVYCGAEHRLFGTNPERPGDLARDLAQEPFVAFTCATQGMGLEPMTMLRDGLGLGRRISGSTHDLSELRRMIVAGLGIGILPTEVVAADVRAGRLWPLALSTESEIPEGRGPESSVLKSRGLKSGATTGAAAKGAADSDPTTESPSPASPGAASIAPESPGTASLGPASAALESPGPASLGADVFLVSSPFSQLTVPEQKFVDLLEELLQLYPDLG